MPHSDYLPELMGTLTCDPMGAFEAGSWASFTLTYTAGHFGIDDTGSLRLVHRFASDQGAIQFTDPQAPNYVSVEASNGAVLELRTDNKGNLRPWDKTLYIKIVNGYLTEGDRIVIRLGDTRQGSPGLRLQTFCEPTFEFRLLADCIATCDYIELPDCPEIAIVPGPAAMWQAVLPSRVRAGDPLRLSIKAEDRWGNPTDRAAGTRLTIETDGAIAGLPDQATMPDGARSLVLEGLSCAAEGVVRVVLSDDDGAVLARSNPMAVVAADAPWVAFWGDIHGQSEETIGTNSARDYFEFARDLAFCDVAAHQGNDFQITGSFWRALNEITAEMNEPGRFVTMPGYEWSGNTAVGGDRNVFFEREGETIRRSSHALVADRSDIDTDCLTAKALLEALVGEDAVVCAHVGGRYADIKLAHDGRIEHTVEVHSAWGTFEWILEDAFEMGYRVGVMCNSDGHKGRPGASYPGDAIFGAYGGLTCFQMPELTRPAVFDCLRGRRHYGTTGARIDIDKTVRAEGGMAVFDADPALGRAESTVRDGCRMGEIARVEAGTAGVELTVRGSAPILEVDIRNGLNPPETFRTYAAKDLGRRIRVTWEGAEYRGRFRMTTWDGHADLSGNRFDTVTPINFYNPGKPLVRESDTRVGWRSVTTGNFCGFDAWLDDAAAGSLSIVTPHGTFDIGIDAIGLEPARFACGGLGRAVTVRRLPDSLAGSRDIRMAAFCELAAQGDNPLYARVTQEDGHRAWTSPVYLFR